MSLDSNNPTAPDVAEQQELSTSSDLNATVTEGLNESPPEAEEAASEEATEQVADAQEESTEPKEKRPRRRKVDAAIRDAEDRMAALVEDRLAQFTATNQPVENKEVQQQTMAANPQMQLLNRKIEQFNQELSEFRTSPDKEEQGIARTVDDMIARRNTLSDIDPAVIQQLVLDGVSPAEVHDLHTAYGDKLVPQDPLVELRTIRSYLRKLRSGQRPTAAPVAPKVRKPHAPIDAIPGGGGGVKRARTAAEAEARFRGK